MKKDFISIKDLNLKEIKDILTLAQEIKKYPTRFSNVLKGKTLVLLFQKPSNRTRVSFEVGMYQLGGYPFYLSPQEVNLGVRESIKDVARTLCRYVDGIVLRTFSHSDILEMAEASKVAVINGLSDLLHPCQALSDIYTIKERFKKLKGVTLAYIGDGNNNVCHSLLYACSKTGVNLRIAAPHGYAPEREIFIEAQAFSYKSGSRIELSLQPQQAVRGADIIYTDVWVSMGREKEQRLRKEAFRKFQVNQRLLSKAKRGCLVMHCLPAHRGQEITDEIMDSKNSIVFEQAQNRLYVQKAILIKLLNCCIAILFLAELLNWCI
jgi:ornithine carbamoyltransferase